MTIRYRFAGLVAALALGTAVLAGCDSQGANTDCGLDQCTVTFDRGVQGEVSILGVDAKLVEAQDDRVTLEVAGEQLSLTVGQSAADVGGMAVTLERVTADQAVVKISR